MIIPHKLPKNGTIGIITTSSSINHSFLSGAIEYYKELGYTIVLSPSITDLQDTILSSSSAKARANEINNMFANNEIDAIISARGGYGAQEILPHLDYNLIAKNPKPFIGFSDVTAVLNAITTRTGLITFLGPTFEFDMKDQADLTSAEFMIEMISKPRKSIRLALSGSNAFVRRLGKPGDAYGTLYGGNLTLISRLVGTPYALPMKSDIIIAIEDISEGVISVDSMLQHLDMSTLITKNTPLLIGEFTNIQSETGSSRTPEDGDPSINVALVERYGAHSAPMLVGLPFSHGKYNLTLPIGAKIKISYNEFSAFTTDYVVK